MAPDKKAHVRVGVAGWYYPDWQNSVYPSGEGRARDHLKYLAEFVDVVEINNTFYRLPDTDAVADWCRRVADIADFKFSLKLWRRFTHEREKPWRASDLRDFLRRVIPIFEKGLGGVMLVQFPHSFHRNKENLAYLKRLLGQIEGIPVVAEMRHYTWDNPDMFAVLEELGAGICSIDQPMFSGSIGPLEHVSGNIGYIRLHGRNRGNWFNEKAGRDDRYDYLYSPEELAPWIERACRMADKAGDVYVITNNHFRGQAVCNAIMFKSMLSGRQVQAPSVLLESYPVLRAYAVPDAPVQGTLF